MPQSVINETNPGFRFLSYRNLLEGTYSGKIFAKRKEGEGVDCILRDIDIELWSKVKAKATLKRKWT